MHATKNFLFNCLGIENKIFWISFSLFFHLLWFSINKIEHKQPYIYPEVKGDAFEYIGSVENLLAGKGFTFGQSKSIFPYDVAILSNNISEKNYDALIHCFRSPGYAIVYLPLRLFLNQHWALSIIILLQILVSSVALYFFARFTYQVFNSQTLFFLSIILLSVTKYYSYYSFQLLTESFALSSYIFLLILLHKLVHRDYSVNKKYLAIAVGILFTFVVFLRPFVFPMILVVFAYMFAFRRNIKNLFVVICFMIIPFLTVDGVWLVRNYMVTKKVVPLASTMIWWRQLNGGYKEALKLTTAIGKRRESWHVESPMVCLLHPHDTARIEEYFLDVPEVNLDSLAMAQNHFLKSVDPTRSIKERYYHEKISERIFHGQLVKYESAKPFNNHVLSRLKYLVTFLHYNQKGYLPTHDPIMNLVNMLTFITNRFVFLIGFLSVGLGVFIYKKDMDILLFLAMPCFIITLFPLYLKVAEARQLYMAYPFMLVAALKLVLDLKCWAMGFLRLKGVT